MKLMKTKMADLNVAQTLEVTVIATVVATAVAALPFAILTGATALKEKVESHKRKAKTKTIDEETD